MKPILFPYQFCAICISILSFPIVCEGQKKVHKSEIFKEIEAALLLKNSIQDIAPLRWVSHDETGDFLRFERDVWKKAKAKSIIRLIIPIKKNKQHKLLIKKSNNLSPNLSWTKVTTYRGIIEDDTQSLVTLNISANNINGIISNRNGNTIIQSTKDGLVEVYNSNTKPSAQWKCSADTMDSSKALKGNNSYNKSKAGDTISLYIVCDYDLFRSQDSSVSNTINYVNSIMNNVAAIYKNESITLLIQDIYVWTTADPFSKADSRATLQSFEKELNEQFEGDLAILLSSNDNVGGGIAYLDGACNKERAYSYANLKCSAASNDNYSWQVHVIAHEIGHNLGSPHTHECVWGPANDQPLDDCATNDCDAVYSIGAGTIMSYCHLTGQKGINFSLGFGKEPGDLIRSKVYQCRVAQGYYCGNAITINMYGNDTIIRNVGPKMGMSASQADAAHATWYIFTPQYDGYINVASCGSAVDTRLHIFSGTCGQLALELSRDDNCDMGNRLFYAASVDSFPVAAHVNYYIEWDDKWSGNGFDFKLQYEYEVDSSDLCTNGVHDDGEDGIDCGGTACIPCGECDIISDQPLIVDDRTDIRSNGSIAYTGLITDSGALTISSGQEISFEAGFEIEIGGQLEMVIESCADYYNRVKNLISNGLMVDDSSIDDPFLAVTSPKSTKTLTDLSYE